MQIQSGITRQDSLSATLTSLMESGTSSNPALNQLIDDYAKYHLVLASVGGVFLLAFSVLGAFCWRRFRTASADGRGRWTFEKKTFFSCGLLTVVVGMFLALVVAANVSTVFAPRQGFSGAISMISAPEPRTSAAELQVAYDMWLQSGSSMPPTLVTDAVDDRLAWQRPKAIICSALLIVLVVTSAAIWRSLIRRSRVRGTSSRGGDSARLVGGILSVAACLLLMLMVMGNTQASVAPLSLTLFYG